MKIRLVNLVVNLFVVAIISWIITKSIGGSPVECYIAASVWFSYCKLYDLIEAK